MWIGVISLFPETLQAVTDFGMTHRAIDNGLLRVDCWNPRDFTTDRHRTVDDRPFGGGPGMVMTIEPLRKALDAARQAMGQDVRVIYLSPQGSPLDQAGVKYLAGRERMVLVAGRYEGIDERFIETEVDEEWSIGDYVLSGGEIAAMAVIDAVTRVLPGVLGNEASALEDSFAAGLLDCPHYTRPAVYRGMEVPAPLLSGDHGRIQRWRLKQSLGRTWLRRPDLLKQHTVTSQQQQLLDEFIEENQRCRQ